MKRAMIDCDRYLQKKADGVCIMAQIHDELLFDAVLGSSRKTRHLEAVCNMMVMAGRSIGVQCAVDRKVITTNWAAAVA